MEWTESGKSEARSNNGVTYLLNDPPITSIETSKPQLVVSSLFECEILYSACPIQDVPKGVWLTLLYTKLTIIYYCQSDEKV